MASRAVLAIRQVTQKNQKALQRDAGPLAVGTVASRSSETRALHPERLRWTAEKERLKDLAVVASVGGCRLTTAHSDVIVEADVPVPKY